MYNRYIPQPDGSYEKRRIPEPPRTPPRPAAAAPCREEPAPPPPKPAPPCRPRPPRRDAGSAGFLRQLLPKNLDAGDLMVILLLLLMSGEGEEDRNTALLTLALYFFL